MALRDLFVFTVVFGSLPFIIKRPYVGVLVFAWLGYMNPHRLSWGMAYSFPFSALVGGLTLLCFFLSNEPKKIPFNRTVLVWILFIGWCYLSFLFALNPVGAKMEAVRFIKIQIMVFLFLAMCVNRERLLAFVGVMVVSVGFFSVKGGLFTLLTGGSFMVLGPPDSFITGNTEIGFASVVILPLMFYFRSFFKKPVLRTIILLCVISSTLGVVGTHSRGAFLALLVLSAYLVFKSNKKILALIVVLIGLPIIFSVMPDEYFNRMETIQTYEEDASAMGRINAWWYAFNLANDRPLTGGGFNAFTGSLFYRYAPNPRDYHDAHSIFFEILGEQGYPGLILFMLLLFFAYRNCIAILRQTRGDPRMTWAFDLGRMLQASFVAYAVGGAFLGLAYFDLLYHLIALTILLKAVVEKEISAMNQVEPENNVAQGKKRLAST